MGNKIKAKKGKLNQVAKEYTFPELLVEYKKAVIAEMNNREKACKSLSNFKKGGNLYLKAEKVNDRVWAIANEIEKQKDKKDEEQDFVDEKRRIDGDIRAKFEDLCKITKLINNNKKKVLSYLKDKDLAKYKTMIYLKGLCFGNHMISDEDEKILKESSTISNLETIYDAFVEDKHHDFVLDENNKIITDATGHDVCTHKKEEIRKNAYVSGNSGRSRSRNVLFQIAKAAVKAKNTEAKFYKYRNGLEAEVYTSYLLQLKDFYYCIDQGDKFAPINVKYNNHINNLKKAAFGLDELNVGDEDIDFKNTKDEISYDEAKLDILQALKCLGPEYIKKVQKCFDLNIINGDKTCDRNMQGYCLSGTNNLDENLINFIGEGTSISVSTLAHELGHNVKNRFMKECNEVNIKCNNLLSEIASIVNSVLIGLYYVEKFNRLNKPKEQLYGIYKNFLGYLLGNITYNSFMHQFVDRASIEIVKNKKMRGIDFEKGYVQNKDMWYGLSKSQYNKQYKKGPDVLENTMAYPMLIENCLNYSGDSLTYYIGSIVAIPVAGKIFIGDKVTLNRYIKFLKKGASTNPLKIVKDTLNIDLLKPQVYTEAKQILNNLVNGFIREIQIKE